MADVNQLGTPKRKRQDSVNISEYRPLHTDLIFQVADAPIDGASSPRTKVALTLKGLSIEGGPDEANAVTPPKLTTEMSESSTGAQSDQHVNRDGPRKRQRLSPEPSPKTSPARRKERRDSETSATSERLGDGSQARVKHVSSMADLDPMNINPKPRGSPRKPKKVTLEPDHTIEAIKERASKRASTPPFQFGKDVAGIDQDGDHPEVPGTRSFPSKKKVVDPVRAALTWKEEEITVYDPDDEDDDGTGINGVGFKPTPAIAHSRLIQRQHQLAEWRKREASEARSRRSQRRRGSPAVEAGKNVEVESSAPRKVRFTEVETKPMIIA